MKRLGLFAYTFLAIGLAMLAGAFYVYRDNSAFVGKAISARGVVIENVRKSDGLYEPVVKFETERGETITFTPSYSSNPPSYRRGEAVSVLYLADDPQRARVDDFWSMSGSWIVLAVLGGVFTALGGGILAYGSIKRRRIADLLKHGIPVEATFIDVERNTRFSFNDQHPFRIAAQWLDPATQTIHVLKSDNIWFDPTAYVRNKHIVVFMDRQNPKRYHMDMSFLPKLAEGGGI